MKNLDLNNEKLIGKIKLETPIDIWIDEFVALRSIMFAFKCGDDSENKLKGFGKSFSKKFIFQENKKCLDGENYQKECDSYILTSVNHEMFLQKIKNSTLNQFDEKRCCMNNIEKKTLGVMVKFDQNFN